MGKWRLGFNAAALAAIAVLVLGICAGCEVEPDIPPMVEKPEVEGLEKPEVEEPEVEGLEEPEAPTANAGVDQTCTLSSNLSVTLDGSSSVANDGSIASYAWTCVSYLEHAGVKVPYTADEVNSLITGANQVTAELALRKAGTYVFKLTVTGSNGKSAASEVTVTVDPRMEPTTITAGFPGITAGDTLDFIPAYGDGYEDGDVAYILEDDVNGALEDSAVNAGAYTAGNTITFTQIFYDNSGTELDRHVVKADVDDSSGNNAFASLRNDNDDPLSDTYELDLVLIKSITELP